MLYTYEAKHGWRQFAALKREKNWRTRVEMVTLASYSALSSYTDTGSAQGTFDSVYSS